MNEVLEKFNHLMAPQPPSYERKKNYKMGRTLGQGSFGIVRYAQQRDTSEEVAIKVILKKSLKSRQDLVFRELEANKLLEHKGVVPFKEWFESKDKFYLVFGICRGGELFERLVQRGRFTERNAIPLIFQIVEAVAYLHDRGVVHRDIKPENLLFESEAEDSRLMLTDFGISNILLEEEDLLSTVCGSRGYVAPEVILKEKYGKPVDMWAIGIMTYLLLSGTNPFKAYDDSRELVEAMIQENYKFYPRRWNAISSEAKDFISSLLKGDPAVRMTAREALKHPWFSGQTASDQDLLDNVREGFDAHAIYKRAYEKLRIINNMMLMRRSSDSFMTNSSSETLSNAENSDNEPEISTPVLPDMPPNTKD